MTIHYVRCSGLSGRRVGQRRRVPPHKSLEGGPMALAPFAGVV
jgi:hypothetical protein